MLKYWALLIVIEQIGLVENVDKTRYMMCFRIRIQDEIKIYRLLIVPLKGWKNSHIREKFKISIFLIGRN